MSPPYKQTHKKPEKQRIHVKTRHTDYISMKRTSKSTHKMKHRITKKMSKEHETKTIGNFEAPQSRTLHFKDGKRVCFNCQTAEKSAELILCKKFGWEIMPDLAKQQRLCRE